MLLLSVITDDRISSTIKKQDGVRTKAELTVVSWDSMAVDGTERPSLWSFFVEVGWQSMGMQISLGTLVHLSSLQYSLSGEKSYSFSVLHLYYICWLAGCRSTGWNFEVFQILFFRPVVNDFGNLFFPYMKKWLVLSAVNSLQCVLLQQPWSHSTNCTNTKQIENMNKNHLYWPIMCTNTID